MIAGLGAGDRESVVEHERFGIPMGSLVERVTLLEATVGACRTAGITTWVGGAHPAVLAVAGAQANGWNRWGGSVDEFRAGLSLVRHASADAGREPDAVTVTWGGVVDLALPVGPIARELGGYADAGASWIIVGPRDAADPDAASAAAAIGAAIVARNR